MIVMFGKRFQFEHGVKAHLCLGVRRPLRC